MEGAACVVAWDLVTSYGWGIEACWKGLLSSQSGVRPVVHFNASHFRSSWAGTVPVLAGEGSRVIQMLSPLLQSDDWSPDVYVILATTVGEIDLLERALLQGEGRPEDCRLDHLLGKVLKLTGSTSGGEVISAACASSSAALARAAQLIQSKARDSVLVVACDAVTEYVYSGFSSLMALDPLPARPFDRKRQGLTLGEAAGFILLMSPERAGQERRPILGHILGWGIRCDANHMTGPSRDGQGLFLAIEEALRSAGMPRQAVAAISAHGTGTLYNDSMEMKAFRRVFGNESVPTCSVKGGLGHTLGAAGLLEAILSLKSLSEKRIPGTIGLAEVDEEAAGWVSSEPVPVPQTGVILSTNSGFGGVNVALLLQAADAPVLLQPPASSLRPLLSLLGAGWIEDGAYGQVRSRLYCPFSEGTTLDTLHRTEAIFSSPVKDFGRLDPLSKRTLCAVALALKDAGIEKAEGHKRSIGILGTGPEGCLNAHVAYFRDYLDSGRRMGRGNLFIYTLPSSALAEAAIHFGLQGPNLYQVSCEDSWTKSLHVASEMVDQDRVPAMVVVASERDVTAAFVVGSLKGQEAMMSLSELTEQAQGTLSQAIKRMGRMG